jgi:hypothetical protein
VRVIIDPYNRQSLNNHKNRSFARVRSRFRRIFAVASKTRASMASVWVESM